MRIVLHLRYPFWSSSFTYSNFTIHITILTLLFIIRIITIQPAALQEIRAHNVAEYILNATLKSTALHHSDA